MTQNYLNRHNRWRNVGLGRRNKGSIVTTKTCGIKITNHRKHVLRVQNDWKLTYTPQTVVPIGKKKRSIENKTNPRNSEILGTFLSNLVYRMQRDVGLFRLRKAREFTYYSILLSLLYRTQTQHTTNNRNITCKWFCYNANVVVLDKQTCENDTLQRANTFECFFFGLG